MSSAPRRITPGREGGGRRGGWKLPLLCVAGAAAAAALIWGLQAATSSEPAIDSELAEISTSWMQDAWEKEAVKFSDEIQSAVRGYRTPSARDASVAATGRRALDDGRLDRACIATRYIQNREIRLSLLREIDNTARGSCATLPWSAFAVRSVAEDDPASAETLAGEVNSRWEACGRNLGPGSSEEGPLPGTARPKKPEELEHDLSLVPPEQEGPGDRDDDDGGSAEPPKNPSEVGASPEDSTPDSTADPAENDIRN